MRTLAFLLLMTTNADAQSCPPAPEPWGPAWPASVEVPNMVVGGPTQRLTPADGEAIRCAVVEAIASPRIEAITPELRDRVRRRTVGPAWMDAGRPRVGSFWVQVRDGEIQLMDTLFMNDHVRIALVIVVTKRHQRWVVGEVSQLTSHARR